MEVCIWRRLKIDRAVWAAELHDPIHARTTGGKSYSISNYRYCCDLTSSGRNHSAYRIYFRMNVMTSELVLNVAANVNVA
jgi:hypothetical protein